MATGKKQARSKVCKGECGLRKPITQFATVAGKYTSSLCLKCHGLRIAAGQKRKKKEKRAAAGGENPGKASPVTAINAALSTMDKRRNEVLTLRKHLLAVGDGRDLHSIELLPGNVAPIRYITEELVELGE